MNRETNNIYRTVAARFGVTYSDIKLAVQCLVEVMAKSESNTPKNAFFSVKKRLRNCKR